jgi:hypothetical protein
VPSFASASFKVTCRTLAARGPFDPIALPGLIGTTHSHDFVGAAGVNPDTTYETLQASPSTCSNPGDHSTYWVPTLLNASDRPVNPVQFDIYYSLGAGERPGGVVSLPQGLKFIAGNSKSIVAQPRRTTSWGCVGNGEDSTNQPDIPTCPTGQLMVLNVRFPQCWDGVNLDSPNHNTHLVYRNDTGCPRTHPVWLPQITYAVRYNISGTDYRLASGSQYSGHGDLFVAWDQAVLDRLVARCINGATKCR